MSDQKSDSTNNRILVVEDSATQREQICLILRKLGCDVFATANGSDALRTAAQTKPQLVISDIVMPGMNGYELCRQIKAHERLSGTAVILVTSLSDPIDVIRGLECGADNFVIKPYDEEHLLAHVSQMLSANQEGDLKSPDGAARIAFSGETFHINSDRRQILNLLLTTYETAVQRNLELEKVQRELRRLAESLEGKVQERTAKLEAEVEERSRAEAALQKQTDILESIVLSMSDALLVTDEMGKIILLNPSAREIFGISPGDPVPNSWPENAMPFLPDGVTPVAPDELPSARALRGEASLSTELFLRRQGASDIRLSATGNAIVRDGEIQGAVVVLRDITENKQMELQMLRSQRMESVGALAGGVAHDLNNVLSPIVMASELLMMNQTQANSKYLQAIYKSAVRGADLVKQLLTFARGDDNSEHKPLPIYQLIRELAHVTQDTFPKNIEIRADIDRNLWIVEGDATQIDQVLLNLCVNARDAMPRGGTIRIAASNLVLDELDSMHKPDAKAGPYVVVSVRDTGTGIPQPVLDRMFEPFFTTKDPGKGTGLGLSTVLGIVRSHGGFIEVDSQPGRGTEFRVYFPAEPSESLPEESTGDEGLDGGNGETILVVDDEEPIRITMRAVLERQGYRVSTAEDGAAGIAEYVQSEEDISLVIADMTMPVMDGLGAVRVLRKIDPHMKAILTSGMRESLQEDLLEQYGVTKVLVKPYRTETLMRAIRETLAS